MSGASPGLLEGSRVVISVGLYEPKKKVETYFSYAGALGAPEGSRSSACEAQGKDSHMALPKLPSGHPRIALTIWGILLDGVE